MATIRDIAQLIARHIPPPNPIIVGKVVQDLGLVADTPTVTVAIGASERRAVYLPPHAITPERGVFVARMGSDLSSPLVVIATNIQVGPWASGGGGGASSGSGLGYGAASAAASSDWATAMTDPTNGDGSLLPMTLGEVSQ